MRIVKKMDLFVLQRFLPLLVMTFFICLFIVMMQFLYHFIEDLVGKGLSFNVIAELFWYASLKMVPIALPLAVLLASLMTFGNLGEKFELTALKSAGISLFRIMAPLIVFMSVLAVGAFFFQNNVLPIAQAKMWTLLFSVRQKSPEVEIPERSFYGEIPGMNLYVEHKNPTTGVLYDMIIYDVSRGMDNARVILADSGKISFTEDKNNIFLHLYRGELFENVQDNSLGFNTTQYMPFRRESFADKKVYIAFDANFNRMDEESMRAQYIGQNISQLKHSIDSIQEQVDSIGAEYGRELKTQTMVNVPYFENRYVDGQFVSVRSSEVRPSKLLDIDSVFNAPSASMGKTYANQALMTVRLRRNELEYKAAMLQDKQKLMRRHGVEMQTKFTLSVACLIFFFIGAPLGAIIKRGGLGYPLVISVILFTIYFIIDSVGQKMARDGKLEVWEGIWLSTIVLFPMGVLLTIAAVNDKEMKLSNPLARFNPRKQKRSVPVRKVNLYPPTHDELLAEVHRFDALWILAEEKRTKRFWLVRKALAWVHPMQNRLDKLVYKMSLSTDPRLIRIVNHYPQYILPQNINTISKTTDELRSYLISISEDAGDNK